MIKNYLFLFCLSLLGLMNSFNTTAANFYDTYLLSVVKTGVVNDNIIANERPDAGETITYSYTVTNTGTGILTSIEIYDSLNPELLAITQNLAPGSTVTLTSTYTITQQNIDAGSVISSSIAAVTTSAGGSFTVISDNGVIEDGNNNPTIIMLEQFSQFIIYENGIYNETDTIFFTGFIHNIGNTTLYNIYTSENQNILQVAPEATAIYNFDYTITETDRYYGEVNHSVFIQATTYNGEMVQSNAVSTVTLPLIFTYSMLGTYSDFNADGFVNVGDLINYSFPITNYGTDTLTNLIVSSPDVTVTGNSIPVLPNSSNTTDFTGSYTITQNDINMGYAYKTSKITFNTPNNSIILYKSANTALPKTSGIEFNAFIDSNGNGFKDAGEQNYNGVTFKYEINQDGILHNVLSSNGNYYIYETNPATTYNISCSLTSENSCNAQYIVSNPAFNAITVPLNSGMNIYNFPISVVPCNDIEVKLFGGTARPGFNYTTTIVYKNKGNQTIDSGTITFVRDADVSIISTSQSGTLSNANGFTYGFSNLLPFESRMIEVVMSVPTIPMVNLGDLLTSTANASLSIGEETLANNESTLSEVIIGAYDPNDITESHGGKILFSDFTTSDYLTYVIRFENTGTASAINIKVVDILDYQLDENSVRMVAASENYILDRVGSSLTWKFDGIDLPPSIENTSIGHGFIVFEVKPKPSFSVGTMIPNTASIYFDFNPAIVTNTFETEFVSTLNTDDMKESKFVVYPNPTNGTFCISTKSGSETIDYITLSDISGKTLFTKWINSQNANLNISHLANGLYLAKIKTGSKEKTIKVIKK